MATQTDAISNGHSSPTDKDNFLLKLFVKDTSEIPINVRSSSISLYKIVHLQNLKLVAHLFRYLSFNYYQICAQLNDVRKGTLYFLQEIRVMYC